MSESDDLIPKHILKELQAEHPNYTIDEILNIWSRFKEETRNRQNAAILRNKEFKAKMKKQKAEELRRDQENLKRAIDEKDRRTEIARAKQAAWELKNREKRIEEKRRYQEIIQEILNEKKEKEERRLRAEAEYDLVRQRRVDRHRRKMAEENIVFGGVSQRRRKKEKHTLTKTAGGVNNDRLNDGSRDSGVCYNNTNNSNDGDNNITNNDTYNDNYNYIDNNTNYNTTNETSQENFILDNIDTGNNMVINNNSPQTTIDYLNEIYDSLKENKIKITEEEKKRLIQLKSDLSFKKPLIKKHHKPSMKKSLDNLKNLKPLENDSLARTFHGVAKSTYIGWRNNVDCGKKEEKKEEKILYNKVPQCKVYKIPRGSLALGEVDGDVSSILSRVKI